MDKEMKAMKFRQLIERQDVFANEETIKIAKN